MNKRIEKKLCCKDMREIIYMKLAINEDLELCPTLKVKSWRKFIKASKYYAEKYSCDILIKLPKFEKKVAESDKTEHE